MRCGNGFSARWAVNAYSYGSTHLSAETMRAGIVHCARRHQRILELWVSLGSRFASQQNDVGRDVVATRRKKAGWRTFYLMSQEKIECGFHGEGDAIRPALAARRHWRILGVDPFAHTKPVRARRRFVNIDLQ
jgi:hypothetical protein